MAHRQRDVRDVSPYLLWFGVIGGPAAWTAHLAVGYLLITIDCLIGLPGIRIWLLALAGAMLALDVVAGLAGYRIWRQLGTDIDPVSGGATGRSGLMAVAGMVFAIVFAFAIVLGAVSSSLLDPCG